MANYGFNFRASSSGIAPLTDGAGSTYVLASDTAPTTRNGITFQVVNSGGVIDSRDRLTTGDARLAGVLFLGNAAGESYINVTLPSTGDWLIRAAFGDGSSSQTQYVRFKEGTTTFATISNISTTANQFVDASGTLRASQSAWISDNASITRTFTTTDFRVYISDPAQVAGNNTTIAHLYIEQVATAPTISTQPTAQSVTAPATANFTAAVSGTYTGLRWQRQAAGAGAWADVVGGSGGTTTSYTTGATAVSGGSFNSTDRFRLAVDWSGGTVLSDDVALTVNAAGAAPEVTVQPTNQSVTIPATATFSVTATGSGTLSYQWQRQPAAGGGYSNISGANSASYTTGATSLTGGSHNNGDTYRCVVTGDTSPPATSNAATLTVLPPIATTVSLTLTTDGSTPAASLSGLKWAFYDQVTPDLFTAAPVAKGAAGTTNGGGTFVQSILGTTLRVGQVGYLIVTNSDGTTTQGAALKGFAGPVAVS